VLAAVIDARRFLDAVRLPVNAQPHEAAAANLVPERLVLLLALALQRRHQVELCPLRQGENPINDLVRRLRANPEVALRAVRLAEASVEDAQVVVDLGDGADGRARALAGRLLLDANGRRQPADVIDLRLLQLAEELPRIRR